MADVTGPISTLPGASRKPPEGQCCDKHPDRLAVSRVQGETDSFGAEMIDMCQECLDEHVAYLLSDEAKAEREGECEWCKGHATDLRNARDYDEGSCGRVYRVCGPCIQRVNEDAARELQAMDDNWGDDFDDDADCWNCGGDRYVFDCFDGCCLDADVGCDQCTTKCEVCRGTGAL